ncbi:PREDICTED: cytochrome P450 3A19-like [Priapulus caudatus]|uniref:Cytochrome P450 3A19-like n=1 Tax=Priapulus caudatus TaxID=37621 RepID=A0ABM1E253_PRICU|nr:PREDICTED: cytochrome P450 3A19-like [Priapulus caudatus]
MMLCLVVGRCPRSRTGRTSKLFFPILTPLLKLLKIQFLKKEDQDFFVNLTTKTLALRRNSKEVRPDFLQLMMDAHKEMHDKSGEVHKGLTDKQILAQSLVFFLAGYETTATLLSMWSYCLATNPEWQTKLQQEVDDVIGGTEITHAKIKELPLLDMFMSEVLRVYPAITRFNREVGKEYKLTDQLTLPKGTDVAIPVYYMHHNEEYWPDHNKFDPERFTAEEKQKRNPYTYVPFGLGPRNCIGMRFAKYEAKVAIVSALQDVTFIVSDKTQVPMDMTKMKPGGFLYPKDGIMLEVRRR